MISAAALGMICKVDCVLYATMLVSSNNSTYVCIRNTKAVRSMSEKQKENGSQGVTFAY